MCMCVIAVFHMHVFESVQWSGSRFFSGTSIAVTLYCLDMILALFKIECAEARLALRAFGRKNKGGVWMWHFDCTLNTQCPLFCFLSSSASFFKSSDLFTIPTLHAYICLISPACPLFWCRGTAERGRKRWSWGWSSATMASCITVRHFPLLIKIKGEKNPAELWNPLHHWVNERWMLWWNHAEGVWHLASCFRT